MAESKQGALTAHITSTTHYKHSPGCQAILTADTMKSPQQITSHVRFTYNVHVHIQPSCHTCARMLFKTSLIARTVIDPDSIFLNLSYTVSFTECTPMRMSRTSLENIVGFGTKSSTHICHSFQLQVSFQPFLPPPQRKTQSSLAPPPPPPSPPPPIGHSHLT